MDNDKNGWGKVKNTNEGGSKIKQVPLFDPGGFKWGLKQTDERKGFEWLEGEPSVTDCWKKYAILYVTSATVRECVCVSRREVLQDKTKYCSSDLRSSQPLGLEIDLSEHRLFSFWSLNSDPCSLSPSLNSHSFPTPLAVPYLTVFTKMNKLIQEKTNTVIQWVLTWYCKKKNLNWGA